MVRIPSNRKPTHPGEMLLEEFLLPLKITQRQLAESIHVPYKRINAIVNRRKSIDTSTALRLSKFFSITPDFWMNLQLRWDLYHMQQSEINNLKNIQPYQLSHQALIQQG